MLLLPLTLLAEATSHQAPPGTLFARPLRDEPGCYFYPQLAQWPDTVQWVLNGYVGVGQPFSLPSTPLQGCPAVAVAYENASITAGRVCLPLGHVQSPQQAAGEVNVILDDEPTAGLSLMYSQGSSLECGSYNRSTLIVLRCDPAADPSESLYPLTVEGDCSNAWNGT